VSIALRTPPRRTGHPASHSVRSRGSGVSDIISPISRTHSSQIATAEVGPQTSLRAPSADLPQNEHPSGASTAAPSDGSKGLPDQTMTR
jgi:hypothetical protein